MGALMRSRNPLSGPPEHWPPKLGGQHLPELPLPDGPRVGPETGILSTTFGPQSLGNPNIPLDLDGQASRPGRKSGR